MTLNKIELDRMAGNLTARCPVCGSTTERTSRYDSFNNYLQWIRTWVCHGSCGAIVNCHVELKQGRPLSRARTVEIEIVTTDTS